MFCNSLEPLVIEVLWHLGAIITVLQNLQQLDYLPWKDLEGPTWDDGHSWEERHLLRRSMNRIGVGKLSKKASKMSNHLVGS